ncbi:MAG: GlxA family transcriptional regulator [Betaproteobacteria bacterium]|jgi:transcriptional regulator GlxA family with amidase domain|nr:helix-turn-helix domain-containing protein [Rubrivivax sp.]
MTAGLPPLPAAALPPAAPPGPGGAIGFALLPGFSLLSLAGATDALAAAADTLGPRAWRVLHLSADGAPVVAQCATRVAVDRAFADAPPLQALVVVSDRAVPPGLQAALRPLLARLDAEGAMLGGIGSGAAELARAGLLAGHRATLHWAESQALAEAHPDVVVSSHLYEIDRRRLTCAGGSASLDAFIAWLGQRHGERLVQALLAHFGLERLRDGSEPQRSPVSGRIGGGAPKLAEAVALMEANLGEPLPTEDIARLVGVSRRQLERLFKQHLDELPSRYYAELRLQRARRLLQQTGQSILQIGLACGFASGSHFSNAYRARFGHTPREARSQRALAWRDQGQAAATPT